jgi:hypothetical protein
MLAWTLVMGHARKVGFYVRPKPPLASLHRLEDRQEERPLADSQANWEVKEILGLAPSFFGCDLAAIQWCILERAKVASFSVKPCGRGWRYAESSICPRSLL